jgi:hypothetical protein
MRSFGTLILEMCARVVFNAVMMTSENIAGGFFLCFLVLLIFTWVFYSKKHDRP